MKIVLAFEKNSESLMAKIIRWYTSSNYSHVEMIIGDKWISSDASVGGVYIRDLKPLKESWDYIEVEVDGRKLKSVWRFIKSQEDAKYDWCGIVCSQTFKIQRKENQDEWFCSEIVTKILQIFGEEKSLKYYPSSMSAESLHLLYS